jgi:hypothetical protein
MAGQIQVVLKAKCYPIVILDDKGMGFGWGPLFFETGYDHHATRFYQDLALVHQSADLIIFQMVNQIPEIDPIKATRSIV